MITNNQLAEPLLAFIYACSELTTGQVYWAFQNAPQPAYPFIDLDMNTYDSIYGVKDSGMLPRDFGSKAYIIRDITNLTLNVRIFSSASNKDAQTIAQRIKQAADSPYKREILKRRQIDTITVDTAVTGEDYTVNVFDGMEETYTAIGGDVAKDIRDALVLQINANADYLAMGLTAEDGSTDNELVMSGNFGVENPVSVSSNMTDTQTQAGVKLVFKNTLAIQHLPIEEDSGFINMSTLDLAFRAGIQYYELDKDHVTTVEGNLEIDDTTDTFSLGE